MSFSKFPDFKKFSLTDKSEYLDYYSLLSEPYCDFSLHDLCIWLNYNNDLTLCELNGNLIIRFNNVLDSNMTYYSLLGTSNLRSTLKEMSSYLKAQASKPTLSFIPKQTADIIHQLDLPGVKIEEDVNNNDYVYKVEDLIKMEGKRYENLRRRISRFTKQNKHIEIKEFNLNSEKDQETIRSSIQRWSAKNNASRNDPENWEINVINKHLELANKLSIHAYGLYSDGVLININIFHLPPQKGWLIFNHIKCDYEYSDVYGYAFYSLFLIAKSKGIKWVNFEQDLGKEGLKRIKTFFRPEKFLRRYTVSLDPDAKYQ